MKCDVCGADPMTANCNNANCDTGKPDPHPVDKGKKLYSQLKCRECKAVWDITFTNTTAHIGEYAMAIEQKLKAGCPDCGGKLKLL